MYFVYLFAFWILMDPADKIFAISAILLYEATYFNVFLSDPGFAIEKIKNFKKPKSRKLAE